MADIREVIARAICRVQLNGGDPDQHAVRWNGTEIEPQSFPAWRDYRDEADHVISALDKAGMVVVPKEPTPKMIAEAWKAIRREQTHGSILGPGPGFKEAFTAMLAAKGE